MPADAEREPPITDDRPPLLRTWGGVYAMVLAFEGLLALLFHLFTRHYR